MVDIAPKSVSVHGKHASQSATTDTASKHSMESELEEVAGVLDETANFPLNFESGDQFAALVAKSVEKAIELQQGYFKSAYESFVAQATKIGGLYADLAKETYKPLEGFVAKNTPAK